MKKYFLIIVCMYITYSCKQEAIRHKPYPQTHKGDMVDDYFGTKIADPYRWLEDDNSSETAVWVQAQNEITQDYLAQIPFRNQIRERLTEIWNYPRYSTPFKKGDFYYFFKNDGLQNQSVLYRQKNLDDTPEIFLDPNTLSDDGTVALKSVFFSNDNRYMTYAISRAGSDWTEFFIKVVETGENMDDHLQWVKFSGAAWKGNGFYYSRYDEPGTTGQYSKQNQFHKVFYHTVGTPQSSDRLVFEDKEHPLRYIRADVTEDEKYLILSVLEGTSGNALYFQSLSQPNAKIIPLMKGFSNNSSVVDHQNGRLLVLTDKDASNYRLTSISATQPDTTQWIDVISETTELLQDVSTGGGKLFAFYLKDASSKVLQLDYSGKIEKEIALPAIGSVSGLQGTHDEKSLFYSFTSFTTPSTIYRYDLENGQSTMFRQPELKFNPDDYEIKQIFYTSKDQTRVPMFIVHKKGMKQYGKNPTFLYSYGGFNINMTPSFSAARILFLENGGVFALPNLRGGGEYGEEWHRAGMWEKKQNVFDDFIAAAEYLISEKYTSPEKLAINGGSNGGLLVGAVMTQRPDLFRVALPAVGVLDMLRYQKFTIGWGWAVEYGKSDNETDFEYLYKYSPLHNIQNGVSYPATLITTADHDDRVVPAHSFKFAATLQELNNDKGDNPILIRIESDAGHGAGKPLSKSIDEATDTWSFVFYQLGMKIWN